jgi:cellulose biosynthesis protein BcsQ
MSKIVCLFNHKGGVSKTTTAFNLGWMLAEKGKRVLLADFDPQCNLTGMVMGFKGVDELDGFYKANPPNLNHAKLQELNVLRFPVLIISSYCLGTLDFQSMRRR